MRKRILVRKYTQGLINSIKDQKEFETLFGQLKDFSRILCEHKDLNLALVNPFLPKNRRMQIGKEIFIKGKWSEKISRFVMLLIENDRLGLLPDILESLPIMWNEKRGISTIEVSSAVPLEEGQKKKLKEKLEILERRPVFLKYRIDPTLVGGIFLRKGNIVYDVSIKGSLESLKEKIIEE